MNPMMENYPGTLAEALRVRSSGDTRIGFIEGERGDHEISAADLYAEAKRLLGAFQARGMSSGAELIVLLNDNPAFLKSFWAGLLGGIVPAPVAVGTSAEHRLKLFRIFEQLRDPWLVTDAKTAARYAEFASAQGLGALSERLRSRTILFEDVETSHTEGELYPVGADDRAFIQFSSGSTGQPKGVVLTHSNLLANIQGILMAGEFTSSDRTLSWMPLTHDLGLIGFHLTLIVGGMDQFLMPSELFARRPLLWLEKATEKKANILCSPNFGYRHWLRAAEGRDLNLNLSHVRLIFNGAEPISAGLCREFLKRLAPSGLKPNSLFPVYGLAEASLAVSFPKPAAAFATVARSRSSLAPGASPERPAGPDAIECVCLGRAIPHSEVQIFDDNDARSPEGVVGRVLIRGKNVTGGYYRQRELNRESINADGWLDTGDLGFISNDEVYITGRSKDIFFVNGQNFYLHDLEEISARQLDVGPGKLIAAAARRNDAESDEVLIFILHRAGMEEFLPVAESLKKFVFEQLNIPLAHVLPVRSIPKTTSGKLQRGVMSEQFLNGDFDELIAELTRLAKNTTNNGDLPRHRSEIEARLKQICDGVMGDVEYQLTDSLFDVCASSLMIAQIHEGIEAAFPGKLDVTDLFDYPTIQALAQHLELKLAEQA